MNRNFIPEKFVQKKNKEEKESIKRGLAILSIANLIMLPININSIMESKNSKKDNYIETANNISALDRKNEILKWTEVLELYAKFGEVNNNSGDMLIKDDTYLNDIKNKVNIIKINSDYSGFSISVVGDKE